MLPVISLAPYIEYLPYVMDAIGALYAVSANLGKRYGPQIRQIYRQLKDADGPTRRQILSEHKYDILVIAAYAALLGIQSADQIYRRIKVSLTTQEEDKQEVRNEQRPQLALATLIMISAFFISSYLAIFGSNKTIHGVRSMPVDTAGIIGLIFVIIFGLLLVAKVKINQMVVFEKVED